MRTHSAPSRPTRRSLLTGSAALIPAGLLHSASPAGATPAPPTSPATQAFAEVRRENPYPTVAEFLSDVAHASLSWVVQDSLEGIPWTPEEIQSSLSTALLTNGFPILEEGGDEDYVYKILPDNYVVEVCVPRLTYTTEAGGLRYQVNVRLEYPL